MYGTTLTLRMIWLTAALLVLGGIGGLLAQALQPQALLALLALAQLPLAQREEAAKGGQHSKRRC